MRVNLGDNQRGLRGRLISWPAMGVTQMNDGVYLPVFSRVFTTVVRSLTIAGLAALLDIGNLGVRPVAHAQESVLTYHYDNGRTGWNSNETTLTPTSVASASFHARAVVRLDDQVDAQPLVVPGLATVGGNSTQGHDVVYVATENNTVYGIDAVTGAVLAQRNLGTPVSWPSDCIQNGPNVGIMGTPVIVLGPVPTMYLVTYTVEAGADVYRIHALNITTLADVVPSVVVTASHQLTNGSLFTFNPASQRQRPGLLAANGNIYVGFGSHCDFNAATSRGWILGWQQNTLTPLAANVVPNTLSTSPENYFLSSVWMSGYGLAADSNGNVYAATGNSDPQGTSYSTTNNLANSVIKLSSDLSTILDFFTPYWEAYLDKYDGDLSSGGVMVVPPQPGPTPNLLTADGKDGTMFLLNAQALGGFTAGGPNADVTEATIGQCWCGPSYFSQTGGGVIVASGWQSITLWNIQTTSTRVSLVNAGSSEQLETMEAEDPGHFTTVSSSGPGPGVIIWSVTKPLSAKNNSIYLVAFSQTINSSGQLTQLTKQLAGIWLNVTGNANIVPVVANGRVYVASYRNLTIFGVQ
jgi:hypothetical protein